MVVVDWLVGILDEDALCFRMGFGAGFGTFGAANLVKSLETFVWLGCFWCAGFAFAAAVVVVVVVFCLEDISRAAI